MTLNITRVLGIAAAIALASPAIAQDTLKLAIGQINNWENQAPTLGVDAGIFKKHNLAIEAVATQGAGETIQAVIGGASDIGIGVGAAGVMRAFSRGAPVRVLMPGFTGTGDIYWYVKADSPIKSFADTKPEQTIAYSTNGSSSHNVVLAFTAELGNKAKATATGGPPATLTQVMSNQIDIGWSSPPIGVKELRDGTIRLLARGSAAPSLRGQTVRVVIVNANSWQTKKEAILRFVDAYRETVDWMYADPNAIKMYAAKLKIDEAIAQQTVKDFYPKEALQTDEMKELDAAVKDAVTLKFLDAPLSKQQLTDMILTPPRKK